MRALEIGLDHLGANEYLGELYCKRAVRSRPVNTWRCPALARYSNGEGP